MTSFTKIILASAFALTATAARADDLKPTLNVEQCINVLAGLSSMNYSGQQFNDATKPAADAKQYKLGMLRYTIASDIAALTPVLTTAQKAQSGFIAELPALPAADPSKPNSTERTDALAAQNKQASTNWAEIIALPCNVAPARLKLSDLKVGDGADENQFPPNVLAAIKPIIDDK